MYARRPTIPETTNFSVMLVVVLTLGPVYAQKPSTPTTPPTTTTSSQDGTDQSTDRPTEYQREMLRIENAKLEQQKRASFYTLLTIGLTAFTVVSTALIGFATVVNTNRNANRQMKEQATLANSQAQLLAKLKALEIVTNATGPTSARQRFEIVKTNAWQTMD
jgi:hypothetical protein